MRRGWQAFVPKGLTLALIIVLTIDATPLPAQGGIPGISLSGVVVDRSGRPVVGALVQAWFVDSWIDAPQVPVMVGATTTGSGGTFLIEGNSTGPIRAAAVRNDGVVNFDVHVEGNGYFADWALDGVVAGTTSPERAAELRARYGGSAIIELGEHPLPAGIEQLDGQSVDPAPTAGTGCHLLKTTVVDTTDRYTVVGEMHITQDEDGTFTYGATADSDVSVGISYNNSTWSLAGTAHVGNSRSSQATFTEGSHNGFELTTQMRYKKFFYDYYENVCDRWEVKATAWNGGTGNGDGVAFLDNHCDDTYLANAVSFLGGDKWATGTATAFNFTAAVSVFGVSLNARSGFSSYVRHHWQFGSNWKYYYLCGNNAKPTYAARVFSGPASNTRYA